MNRTLRICIALLLAALSFAAFAAAKDPVSIAILPEGANAYRVSVLFPTAVGKKRGDAEVKELWRRTGWRPAKAEWVISPAFRKFPAQMSVEFTVGTLYPKGAFPVEDMALAFKSWGGVDITAATMVELPPNSPPHYEDADASIDITTGSNSLAVSVRIKNPKLEHIGMRPLPQAAPNAQPAAPKGGRGEAPFWAIALVAVGLAGIAWIVVYVLMSARRQRGGRA